MVLKTTILIIDFSPCSNTGYSLVYFDLNILCFYHHISLYFLFSACWFGFDNPHHTTVLDLLKMIDMFRIS